MKLGEIKAEALRLMNADVGNIDVDEINTLSFDENYKDYLMNMPGAINRCFADIEERRVLPQKSMVLRVADGIVTNGRIRFDVEELIPNMFDIDRIISEYGNGRYDCDCEYGYEAGTVVLETNGFSDVTYTVIYRPSLQRITFATPNSTELDEIPEGIAAYIPYFIKGDLYRVDEPNEANEARRWYEQAISEISDRNRDKIGRVQSVYSQVEI